MMEFEIDKGGVKARVKGETQNKVKVKRNIWI